MVKLATNGFGRIGRVTLKMALLIVLISFLLAAVSGAVGGLPLRFIEPVFCIQVVGAICPPFAINWLYLFVDFGFWAVIAVVGFSGLRIILRAKTKEVETQQNSKNEGKLPQAQSLSEQTSSFKSEIPTALKNKLLIIGIGVTILLVLAAGIAGYLVYRNYQFKKQSASKPIPSPQPTQSPAKSDSTVNWKKYRNEEYGFQIDYPEDWIYEEKAEEYPSPSKMEKRILFSPASVFHINPGAFSIQFYEPESKLSLREFIETFLCHSTPEGDTCSGIFEDDTDFSLKNDVSARKIIYHPRASFSESIFFENNRVFFEFEINFEMPYYKGVTPDEKREIFNQILSTFQFLDQAQTNQAASWNTYSNSEWGISFKYKGSGDIKEGDINNPAASGLVMRYGSLINMEGTYGFGGVEIRWGVWLNQENLTLKDFYEKYIYKDYSFNIPGNQSKFDKNYKINNTDVIGEDIDARPEGVSYTAIYLQDFKNRIHEVTLIHHLDDEKMKVTEEIIKTIKID